MPCAVRRATSAWRRISSCTAASRPSRAAKCSAVCLKKETEVNPGLFHRNDENKHGGWRKNEKDRTGKPAFLLWHIWGDVAATIPCEQAAVKF